MKPAAFALAAGLACTASSPGWADDLKAEHRFTDTAVGFDLRGNYSDVTLTIAGPNRFHTSASERIGAPTIDLRRFGPVEDGTYTYHLSAATGEAETIRTKLDDGRTGGAGAEPRKSATASGTFQVKGGVIVKPGPSGGKKDQP
jgi:hypothetical protein